MLDILGAIFGTAAYAVIVGALIGYSPLRTPAKLAAYAAAASWGILVVAIGALGGFAPGATGPVPAPVLAFVVLVALLFAGWYFVPRFRQAATGVPLPALVGVNIARLGGLFFILVAEDGRLSGPFPPIAGGGDILVGALAIPLAALAARRADAHTGLLRAWNALGALDLIVAIALGALSAPGTPIRVFTEGPGTLAMTTLPWAIVPAMLVPIYLLIHFVIAMKLRSSAHVGHAFAT